MLWVNKEQRRMDEKNRESEGMTGTRARRGGRGLWDGRGSKGTRGNVIWRNEGEEGRTTDLSGSQKTDGGRGS